MSRVLVEFLVGYLLDCDCVDSRKGRSPELLPVLVWVLALRGSAWTRTQGPLEGPGVGVTGPTAETGALSPPW